MSTSAPPGRAGRFPTAVVASRQLGDALVDKPGPATVTPWLASLATAPANATRIEPSAEDRSAIAALRDEAIAAGRAAGLGETERLRGRLAAALDAAGAARTASSSAIAAQVAELAAMVVETWLGALPAGDRIRPIITRWLATTAAPATARVHPSELDAMLCAVDDSAITVVADADLMPGDVVIDGGAFELRVDWCERLVELRELIRGALQGSTEDDA